MTRPPESYSPQAIDLLKRSMAWMDAYWHEDAGLLWALGEDYDPQTRPHLPAHTVRETAWYALGLLMRDEGEDVPHAICALHTILAYQFDEPGKVYHGTFYRYPEEPHPPEPAQEWRHYDPNWREFIITVMQIILQEYAARLPGPLVARIDDATRRAVMGALARGLRPGYTNIALMHAPMLVYAGQRLHEPAWVQAGEVMAREVHRLFKQHDAFEEYNSPTYYGPDLYGLGLWQFYCASPELARLAAEMEAALWLDIARFYHAALRNLAGPFDRSYGMDMNRYVALVGQWIWLATGAAAAPHPDLNGPFAHPEDVCFGPLAAILGARVPDAARPHFAAFQGERTIERVITDQPRRVATAWLGERVMFGAERTGCTRPGSAAFHPATVHWQAEPGYVGWIRLVHTQPADAVAARGRLEITGTGPLSFIIDAPGANPGMITADAQEPGLSRWHLPGLTLTARATAPCAARLSDGRLEVVYDGAPGTNLNVTLEVAQTDP